MADTALYRRVWRWHFYAGLFVLPFILVLSVTGAIYLFKPQLDRWEERAWLHLPQAGAVSADQQVEAALAAFPGAQFQHYRLPREMGDAAMIQLGTAGGVQREVYVSPAGKVLGTLDPEARLSAVLARFHGSLMLGKAGDWLVELAASWTIVLIVSGLFLWRPRGGKAGHFLPRLRLAGRPKWKDLHRTVGLWCAGFVLVLLASGLPWAGVWGSAFKAVRTELGLIQGPQNWKIGADDGHGGHGGGGVDHAAMGHAMPPAPPQPEGALPIHVFVTMADAEGLALPVLVLPPHAPQKFGPPTGAVWTAKSEAQNRTLNETVTYDPMTGAELSRSTFADKHPIDRAVNYGIAWHEGQLFGLANQLIGVATALALIFVAVAGTVMWLKRRPQGALGAPEAVPLGRRWGLFAVIAVLAALLPLFAVSLAAVMLVDAAYCGLKPLARKIS